MTQDLGILEFPVIAPLRDLINSKIPSLRGVSETNDEAISFKIPSKIPSKFRHCEQSEAIS